MDKVSREPCVPRNPPASDHTIVVVHLLLGVTGQEMFSVWVTVSFTDCRSKTALVFPMEDLRV